MLKVLVVDDDQGLRTVVRSLLEDSGRYEVIEAFDGINAIEKFEASPVDIVLLDVDMPRLNGIETLRRLKSANPGLIVLMMTAYANIKDAVDAVKEGAYNYLSKPVQGEELLILLDKALSAHLLISSAAASAPMLLDANRKMIGNNQQMQRVFGIIHRLSKVDTPVLIRGASGTGKELVARAIHFNSSRKEGKFVAINCSAIPENLFESELFGHEKGSFTGADQRKIGKFQYAEGGTLFLDEVGDLPLLMQVKLLRVLQEKLFTPVGSNREIQTNVRIVAATNRPLEEMIKTGSFREDLFYRLNVIPIFLPPLKDRVDDLERLISIFLHKFNSLHGRKVRGLAADALKVLKKYSWPGNIRELENVIEHAFIMETSDALTLASLPDSVLHETGTQLVNAEKIMSHIVNLLDTDALMQKSKADLIEKAQERLQAAASMAVTGEALQSSVLGLGGLDEEDHEDINSDNLADDDESEELSDGGIGDAALSDGVDKSLLDFNLQKELFEKEFIIKALKLFKGRINQTALHANIPKKTLLRKLEKYGINAKDFSG